MAETTPAPRLQRLFDALLTRDGAGGTWLRPLLAAAPRGREALGDLVDAPGWLQATVAVRTETGRRGAFEHPAAPAPRLLGWYIAHPDALVRPGDADEDVTAEAMRLRRALLDDEPSGARARAQARAHEMLRAGVPLASVWWRFEEAHRSDCVLTTDRLVLLVRDGDRTPPATPWYPARSGRVRDLEAAQRIADGEKAWGVLTLSADPARDAAGLAGEVDAGAPHLDAGERAQLVQGDLGACSWEQATAVTGGDRAVQTELDGAPGHPS